jgi:hypothetical protein
LALGRLKATELICQQARLLWMVLAGDVHCHFRLRATLTIETAIISAFTSFIPTIGADILALKAVSLCSTSSFSLTYAVSML